MKCEYCDNELPLNALDRCPFCGVSLIVQDNVSNAQETECDSIDIICPNCRSSYIIKPDEWGRTCKCEICHNSFPLTYGKLSSAQTELIWKNQIVKVIDSWRNGSDCLFAARQGGGDILLKSGEVLYEYVENVLLSESRGIRRMVSERSSYRNYDHDFWSDRVRKTGEQYNYSGHSETATDYEYRELDCGTLYLTNRRLFFIGNQMQRSVNLERIISFVPDLDGNGEIRISEEDKQKILRFSSDEDMGVFFKFSLIMRALRDANFKRFLLEDSIDDVAIHLMKYSYFENYKPKETQLSQSLSEDEIFQRLDELYEVEKGNGCFAELKKCLIIAIILYIIVFLLFLPKIGN